MDIVLMSSNLLGGTSSVLNGMFLVFLFVSPPKHLGHYKNYYYLGAYTSFFFAVTQCYCAFTFFSDGSLMLFISTRRVGHFAMLLFIAAHNALFIAIAYNFVHRYRLISDNQLLTWIHDRATLTLAIHIIHFSSAIVPADILLNVDATIRTLVHEKYGKTLSVDFTQDFFYAISYEKPIFGSHFATYLSGVLFLLFGGSNIAIMLIGGIGMYRYTAGKSRSEKVKRLNRRLLITLSCQAIFSLLFVYLPGLICLSAFLLRIDLSHASPYVSAAMSCGTLFNPIADFILSSEYRQKLLNLFKRRQTAKISFNNIVAPKVSLSSVIVR